VAFLKIIFNAWQFIVTYSFEVVVETDIQLVAVIRPRAELSHLLICLLIAHYVLVYFYKYLFTHSLTYLLSVLLCSLAVLDPSHSD